MDNYQLNEEIGKGPFSTAYKGRKRRTTNFYAILSTDKCRRMRVLNSVHILRAVQHPCVIKFYNWFETNNHLWVITEYCAGGDLKSILKDTVMSETSLRVLGRDIATGLMHFHSLGYLYNDLKPDNLLMDSIPSLRFYDFGNSCPIGLATQRHLVGTPAYLAPELFLPQPGVISMASDLWSLGCVLYEMATGAPPFAGDDLSSLLLNILTQPAPRAEKLSAEFNNLLKGLLEKDPRRRFTWSDVAASEFWEELLAMPLSGFPPEPAFAEYAKQAAKGFSDDELRAAVQAAVVAATSNLAPNSRRSEENVKTKNISFEELDFTPVAGMPESGAHGTGKTMGDVLPKVTAADTVQPAASQNGKQAQLSKVERANTKETPISSPLVNMERSGSAEMERHDDTSGEKAMEKMEVFEARLDESFRADLRKCIWHHSDTHIRPLCMNSRIERYVEPTLTQENLPFQRHTLDELKHMGHDGITAFLGTAYRALANEKKPETKIQIFSYFEIIVKDASISNILINSSTMDLCYRLVEDGSALQELRAQAAMIIGQLVRHTTFIHQDVVRAGIIQRTMVLFTREKNYVVKRRLLVCLGELLFYIAVQTPAERDGWGIESEGIQQLYLVALESDDEVLRHYAIKGIENVASVTDRFMARKLFATTAIAERLIAIYKTGQGSQSKGEHMRSSAMCAACKLASASDRLLSALFHSQVFPVSEYPAAIKRSHIPLTAQLLLTVLVYGLYRALEIAKEDASGGNSSGRKDVEEDRLVGAEEIIRISAGVCGRVLESVRELNDKSTTAMRGKCLLLISLLGSLGGPHLAQICSNTFPAFLDRLMVEKDSYVQECVVPFTQSLNLYITETLRMLRDEVSSALFIRALRHLLSSTVLRQSLNLDKEAFQYLGECVQKCLSNSSHTTYEDEFHSVMERFLAPEFAKTKLNFICIYLTPPLLHMVEAPKSASRFFAVRLWYTLVSSLLVEYPSKGALTNPDILRALTQAVTNIAKVLSELIEEPQPVPSHTFRLLAACGEWSLCSLDPLCTEESTRCLIQHISSSNTNTNQMPSLQLLQMLLSKRTELIRVTVESGFHPTLGIILSQKGAAEGQVEIACSVAATLFTTQLDDAVAAVIRKRVPAADMTSMARVLLSFCVEDRATARFAANALEGMSRISTEVKQTLLGSPGLESLISICKLGPSSEYRKDALETLLRAVRDAARELAAYQALCQEASLLLTLHNSQVQGWPRDVLEEATMLLHEIEENTSFPYPSPVQQ